MFDLGASTRLSGVLYFLRDAHRGPWKLTKEVDLAKTNSLQIVFKCLNS